jgi:hypothetical protein
LSVAARFSAVRFSIAAASSSVRNALSFIDAGRSSGVSVALVQMPCRSGCPSGVRVAVHFA